MTVVDADVHLVVEDDELAAYLDKPYRSRVSSEQTPNSTWQPNTGWDFYNSGKIENLAPTFTDAEAVVDFCDKFHIDHPILNTFQSLARFPEDDFAIELMRAYNDWMMEQILDYNDEWVGLLNLAPQRPAEAAEEINRLGDEDQIVGVYIGNTAANPPLGDPRYDVMYKAAEDHDLSVSYHGRVGDFMIGFPRQYSSINNIIAAHSVGHMWTQSLTVASLVVNGVPEKFPNLNFNITESGISWVPFMMWRLNEEYAHRPNEAPLLEKSPEEYIRESFYFSTQPLGEPNNDQLIFNSIDSIGLENLMFASDYPHWDFNNPDSIDKRLRRNYSEEERAQLFNETAAEAFGLEL